MLPDVEIRNRLTRLEYRISHVLNLTGLHFGYDLFDGNLDGSAALTGNIHAGQTAYDTGTGFWIEYNAGTPRLSIGNSAGNKVTWNGTTLAVTGTLTATSGTIGGWSIGATTLTGGATTLDSAGVLTLGTSNDVVIASSADATYRLWVGHATAASAPFRVTKAGVLTATSGTVGGWTLGSSTLTGGNVTLDSTGIIKVNYTAGQTGAQIDNNGNAEFNNITARGALNAAVMVYNQVHATGGSLIVSKSAFKLRTTFATLDSPTTFNVDAEDAEGSTHAASQLAIAGDILRLKDGVSDAWLAVSSVSDQTTFWRYVCTKTSPAAATNYTFYAGAAIVNYGQSGQGFLYLTADDANGPFYSTRTHAGSPHTTTTEVVRTGNLNGNWGYVAATYGFAAGEYAASKVNVTLEATNGLRIRKNTATQIHLQPDGDVFIGEDVSAAGTTYISIFVNAQTYNSESMSAGDMLIGDNSSSKANILWDKSAGQLLFRGGTTTQAYVDTSGAIIAGAGNVSIGTGGIDIVSGTGTTSAISWLTSSVVAAEMYGATGGGLDSLTVAVGRTASPGTVNIYTVNASGTSTENVFISAIPGDLYVQLQSGTEIKLTAPTVTVSGDIDMATANWIGLSGSAGRIVFTDAATDTVAVTSADFSVSGGTTLSGAVTTGSDVTVGSASSSGVLSANGLNSGTTTLLDILTLNRYTSGTADVGLGGLIKTQIEDDGGTARNALQIAWSWAEAVSATRKSRARFFVEDTATREALRLEASGTAAMIGFLGAAAVVRQTVGAAAPAGGTGATAGAYDTAANRNAMITLLNNIRTAGVNLGLWAT